MSSAGNPFLYDLAIIHPSIELSATVYWHMASR